MTDRYKNIINEEDSEYQRNSLWVKNQNKIY